MSVEVNQLRNPDFSRGKAAPANWRFESSTSEISWHRPTGEDQKATSGVTLTSLTESGSANFSQVARCKPKEFYRIEALLSCSIADGTSGATLVVEPMKDDQPMGLRRETPSLRTTSPPTVVKAIYQAPEGVRKLRLSVQILDARGTVSIHTVRLIRILDPDEDCHILATPAPSNALRPPCQVKKVCVCSEAAPERPVRALLEKSFGVPNVDTLAPKDLAPAQLNADAVLLPDDAPPSKIRTLAALMKLSEKRIVIVSLTAFEKLAAAHVRVRRIMQVDDPIHAKIMLANYATQGFALQDVFAYAWPGKKPGSFVQRQFYKTKSFTDFCKKKCFDVLLEAVCDKDATSDKPCALYKETSAGALVVLDIDPVETADSTSTDQTLAAHLLLSILGKTQAHFGQFTSHLRKEEEFREAIRELPLRFEHVAVHDDNVPTKEVTQQLVTIGGDDMTFGLPLQPKPVVLVRAGLTGGDVESVYGTLYWFKHLIRPLPYPCTYAEQLASKFRLSWIPCEAPWEVRDGWQRTKRPPALPSSLDIEDDAFAALIDVVSIPENRIRIVWSNESDASRRCQAWLPVLAKNFLPRHATSYDVPQGAHFTDRTLYYWRVTAFEPEVVVDRDSFEEEIHQDVLNADGQVIRIEIPGCDHNFTSQSIIRTDLAASMLELVTGTLYGLVAVNRTHSPIQLDAFPPLAPGEALIVEENDPALKRNKSQVG